MGEVIGRLLWFIIVASAAAYVSYLIVGSIIETNSSQAAAPVLINDSLEPGVHHLSGMIMVPSSCYELSVRTEELSPTLYGLFFKTWRDPAIPCSKDSVPRAFRAILFAPAVGVDFIATLDDTPFTIAVVPIRPEISATTTR